MSLPLIFLCVSFPFSIGDILDELVIFIDRMGQVSLDLEGEGAARDVDRDDGLGVVVSPRMSTQCGVVVVAVDEQSSVALLRQIISGMGEDVDGLGCVDSEDLDDLSVDDAADLFCAGIHGACVRGCTEFAIFDELCCRERSLGRSEEHVGRSE